MLIKENAEGKSITGTQECVRKTIKLIFGKISTMKRTPVIDKSPLYKAYVLLGASDPRGLSDRYLEEDQKIVTSRISDYHDRKLITNKVKNILERIDTHTLSSDERHERRLIMWLWYHHAISYAVWGYKDKRRAQKYSSLALKYQPKNHPDQITRLLYLLVRDRFPEAERWGKTIKMRPEKTTALRLLKFYNERGFFV
ncbi:MAG: hypothetical protein A2665_01170 [Candidatus Zambryskibacteria bacterium RIFCSPHIGHO2_01_FULL_46_30]|uniref:Uncharacterized protein n=1 Tax=Candidatus Zambryskibacteria bacterium RIFCSPHIGHO2_01_FULL_46_30 TaxID=1802739 RepID=A0A1G2SYQ6_9BACT|nr:MAG: hypothetical protein A2665_01170 [Candidatus Zambryskibacteria bacterium RIFCSPHIGHO2_01_FULL_46_30]OHB05599.1 MAG: hypothetical protein A3B22_02405 [Candidatus Zambryskibacteria bacterium RIFCSPLOWO2_01_FULL_47_33]